MLAHVMGVRPSTAESWLAKGTMSRKAALRAARWLETKAAELEAIASEIERLPEGKAPFGRPRAQKKKAPG